MFTPMIEEIKAYVPFSSIFLQNIKSPAVWIADGDGMIGAGIMSEDWLICDTARLAKDGDIVIAMVNGEPMCRRFFLEENAVRFRREDGKTPDILTNDCQILAVYCGIIRSEFARRFADSIPSLCSTHQS